MCGLCQIWFVRIPLKIHFLKLGVRTNFYFLTLKHKCFYSGFRWHFFFKQINWTPPNNILSWSIGSECWLFILVENISLSHCELGDGRIFQGYDDWSRFRKEAKSNTCVSGKGWSLGQNSLLLIAPATLFVGKLGCEALLYCNCI